MWHKPDENNPQSLTTDAARPGASSQPRAQVASSAPQSSSNASTSVSQGITIKGEIFGKEDLFVDGTIHGKMHFSDGSVTIGPNGHVHADIEAREIIILGAVTGTLKASDRVQISSTGKLTGDMQTRGIVVEEGAFLSGKVEVIRRDESSRATHPAASPTSTETLVRAASAAKSSES